MFGIKKYSLESFDDDQRVKNLELLCTKFSYVEDQHLTTVAKEIAEQLSATEKETLTIVHTEGPVDSGHLLSKTANDFLPGDVFLSLRHHLPLMIFLSHDSNELTPVYFAQFLWFLHQSTIVFFVFS